MSFNSNGDYVKEETPMACRVTFEPDDDSGMVYRWYGNTYVSAWQGEYEREGWEMAGWNKLVPFGDKIAEVALSVKAHHAFILKHDVS